VKGAGATIRAAGPVSSVVSFDVPARVWAVATAKPAAKLATATVATSSQSLTENRGAGVAAAKRVTSSLPDIIGVDGHEKKYANILFYCLRIPKISSSL